MHVAKVLITGGAGFIGSHIVDAVLEAGLEPVVLDLRGPRQDVEHVRADVRNSTVLARVLPRVELVCHQAAMVGLGVRLEDLPAYVSHNCLGTATLLCELARAQPERLVLGSSMVVYGEGRYACRECGPAPAPPRRLADLQAGRFDPSCPVCGLPLRPQAISESAVCDPRNVYAATKLHQEHLVQAWARETGVPVTILRYHNVYGPRMPRATPYAGVAALFADALAGGRAPRVFEDGWQQRDFVHVRDVARANLLALSASPAITGALNVCSGQPRTVGELARTLHDVAFASAPTPIVSGEFRLGDVRHVFADPTLAASTLGFAAREPFAAGVAELAEDLVGAR